MSIDNVAIDTENTSNYTDDVKKITEIEIVNDCIRNPNTGRFIKVGGRIFNELVNKKILNLDIKDKGKVLYYGDTKEEVLKVKNKLNIQEDDKHVVKTRNNKIITQRRTVSRDELTKKTREVAIQVYRENSHLFNDSMSSAEISDLLKTLISKKMIDDSADVKLKESLVWIAENVPSDEEVDDEEIDLDETEEENYEDTADDQE